MSKLPDKCPACGSPIALSTGTLGDSTKSGWSCTSKKCNAFGFKKYDHPQITIGRQMAGGLKGVHCMSESITHLPCNVQIGILRERHRQQEQEDNDG